MIQVVRRTGHSSYYVEKGMGAMGRTPRQMGIQGDTPLSGGGKTILIVVHVEPPAHFFHCIRITIYNDSIPNLAGGDCYLASSSILRLRKDLFDTKNAPCCPIAIVGCYSGSSYDDHHVSRGNRAASKLDYQSTITNNNDHTDNTKTGQF